MSFSPNLQPRKLKRISHPHQNQTTLYTMQLIYPYIHFNLFYAYMWLICWPNATPKRVDSENSPDFVCGSQIPKGKLGKPRKNTNNCRNKCKLFFSHEIKWNEPNSRFSHRSTKVFGKFSKQINLHSTAGSQKKKETLFNPPRWKEFKKFNPGAHQLKFNQPESFFPFFVCVCSFVRILRIITF